jgi:hypothetical protein
LREKSKVIERELAAGFVMQLTNVIKTYKHNANID